MPFFVGDDGVFREDAGSMDAIGFGGGTELDAAEPEPGFHEGEGVLGPGFLIEVGWVGLEMAGLTERFGGFFAEGNLCGIDSENGQGEKEDELRNELRPRGHCYDDNGKS